MLCLIILLIFVSIPLVLSILSVIHESAVLLAVAFVSHFLILKFIPLFKGRENMWMFVMVLLSGIPINIRIINILNGLGLYDHMWYIVSILMFIVLYAFLFSIEEIAMGIMTRLLWGKQYKNILNIINK